MIFAPCPWRASIEPYLSGHFKYARAFGGQDPILSEESIFRVTVMLPPHAASTLPALIGWATGTQPGAESGAESQEQRLLVALCAGPLGKAELARWLGLPGVSGALNRAVRCRQNPTAGCNNIA